MSTFKYEEEQAIADQILTIANRSKPRISQAELAKAAGISRESMSNYLTGKRAMPLPVLIAICERLDVELNTLVSRAYAQLGQSGQ